ARDHLPFRVVGGGDLSQADHRLVGLVALERGVGELAGLAEEQRQQPLGEWIESSAVAGLVGIEQAPGALQRRVGREPARLVQEQQAVDLQAGPVGAGVAGAEDSGSESSSADRRALASSIRRLMAIPRSVEGSWAKRISGVVWIRTRRPSCERMNPAAARSPASVDATVSASSGRTENQAVA